MEKGKRKRNTKATKVPIPDLNDGMNTPVPNRDSPSSISQNEMKLYKQAENPLGAPHKI
jgi:hypothetical protein